MLEVYSFACPKFKTADMLAPHFEFYDGHSSPCVRLLDNGA